MTQVERVKALCKERKISIHKLEVECGFSNGYISQLRKGVFPYDRLKMISDYLRVEISDLLGETKTPATADGDGLSDEDMEIVELLMQIAPEDRQTVLALLRSLSAQHEAPPSAEH